MLISKALKIFVVALAVTSIPTIVFAVPQLPHLFYGTITINGSPAPTGTVIIAKVGGVEKGRITTTETGKYGGPGVYDQKLLVQGDDLQAGNTIVFTVSGVAGQPTATFESGKVEELNLAFTIVATPTGGDGGYVSTPTSTPQVLSASVSKGDSNNDGKVDILDFNLLMVNWGSVAANNPSDSNGDNKVDILDFNLLMVNWSL